MNTLHLVREIYTEGFKNLGSQLTKNYFKIFAWFSFAMYGVVMYAFIFRISTGFAFD
ncbi:MULTISPECIES: DUF6747 family protein [Zeaxanthinibacter]|uniref:DUF6747 family protein n=1 Tax=Zeaxanthinibacter TaxID=561554 RepID=UPI00300E6D8F